MIRFRSPRQRGLWLGCSGLVALIGCATPERVEGNPGDESGGSANSEGGSTSGGAGLSGAPSFGGGPSSGGSTQGGAPSSGGSMQGGAPSSGGSMQGGAAQGGAKSTGGSATSGGGGNGGSGSGSSSGGAAQGGAKSTGGSATGGSSGGAAQGGATSKGGSGGALPSAGGSSGAASGGSSSSGGGTGCSGAVFCDDFEDGNSTGWTPTGGTWAVTSDGTQVYSGGLGSYLSTAGGSQTNQTVQVRMKVLSMNSGSSYRAGIVARVSGSDYYVLALDGAGDFRLLKGSSSVSGASGTCAAVDSGLGSVTGTWMTLRMVVSGSGSNVHITTFRDATELHDCTTTSSTLTSGNAGVMTYGTNTRAVFDDFRLSSP